MKAMIFAAGLGTRLKPITDTLPKALVPIYKKPLIEYVARKLLAAGINDVVVNVHAFADKIEQWINEQEWIAASASDLDDNKMFVSISDERKLLLETGGAILHARHLLEGEKYFLVHNVDILSDCDINGFISQTRENAVASLLVSKRNTSRFLLFDSENMRLVGRMNVATGDYQLISSDIRLSECNALAFSGIHLLNNIVFDLMEQYIREKSLPVNDFTGTCFPIMDFYMWAAVRFPIYGIEAERLDFVDVGKLETLKTAEEFVCRNKQCF